MLLPTKNIIWKQTKPFLIFYLKFWSWTSWSNGMHSGQVSNIIHSWALCNCIHSGPVCNGIHSGPVCNGIHSVPVCSGRHIFWTSEQCYAFLTSVPFYTFWTSVHAMVYILDRCAVVKCVEYICIEYITIMLRTKSPHNIPHKIHKASNNRGIIYREAPKNPSAVRFCTSWKKWILDLGSAILKL